ncbi:RQC-minor-1 family DNA-binding protein [Gracilibacillus salinarum]|uniref:Zinc-ribbon domain containing protein n=1 Tax=Gracilibacillus salinarum TaxID=2932255 RepID=A0ABY4GJ05_9BACI|nr:RQC-minor-1 family DNA-binding protein [Gracilibacillus salinarum]UOQ83467.1 zinc-ribbon domain containing protein [Gracilibacillus salinarum]
MKDTNRNNPSVEEIKVILRAADELIGQGGKTLLAKILKGSREKRVLELDLDECPVYGYFKSEKIDVVKEKIDWMIDHKFLEIQYSGKLPMIIYTERGWIIERDQRVDEFLDEWQEWIKQGMQDVDMTYLKGRNREMLFLLLEKVYESGNQAYIPYLKLWKQVDYKKVKAAIQETIEALENQAPIDEEAIQERNNEINKLLKGYTPRDETLKCWECGERFVFTVGEQQFFKQKGFHWPKRCESCRFDRKMQLL